ncbi:MAG TPA: histidine kinase dimerization/phospho-acceptor domain-containing protein, partial [Gemmatimonadales bacterium]|nr:histidine kinase dimerization/phospho-acceptor domain-containing protein [Gemmatimonadales bacterium]
MTFAARLILGATLILFATTTALTVASTRVLRHRVEAALTDELERDARLVALGLERRPETLHTQARRYGNALGRRVTLIAEDGRVLGDSDFDDVGLQSLENHADRPEVRAARQDRRGVTVRQSESTNRLELKVAIPAWPGIVRVSADLAEVEAIISDARRRMWAATLAVLVAGSLGAVVVGRSLGRPLRELAGAARALPSTAAITYPTSRAPEIRHLSEALRSMQAELAARMGDLAREQDEAAALMESMVEGVIGCNAEGAVVAANAVTRRLLGYGPDEPLPGVRELFRPREARNLVDLALAGTTVPWTEVELNGRTILMTARTLPTRGAVFILHDLTDLRRLETVRRDFVANVSHELKTPLTSMVGYVETLLREPAVTADQHRFLEVVYSNARRMQRLVDDLLDLARLESGAWKPKPELLDALLVAREAWAPFADRAQTRKIAFRLDAPAPPARLLADPGALRQILANLFDNALRYTPDGGSITVAVRPVPEAAEITVADTGAG